MHETAGKAAGERARIESLERRVAELDSFNHMVAHELRAPLQAISGFARHIEQAEGRKLSEESRSRLRRVVDNASKMDRLIDHLLMLSRAERIAIEKHAVAVDAVVRDILAELRQAYPETRLILSELPMVSGDATVVRQVFANLIGNALKFSHLAPDPVVEIALDSQGNFVVRDNGIGFRFEDASALFRPFHRFTADPAYPGTGVGLAIVQRLLERHGGWIAARSREGGPTEFTFSFGED